MTKEELDLFITLQPVFASFRGEWQVRDDCYDAEFGQGEVTLISSHSIDVGYISRNRRHMNYLNYGQERPLINIAWLPKPIDPDNPSRGLWGMVNWSEIEETGISSNGLFYLVVTGGCEGENDVVVEGTPTLALLRAIEKQQEGE